GRTTFRGLLGWLRAPRARHLADSRISRENEFAGAQRSFLEILRIGGKELPASHLLRQNILPHCLLPQNILPQHVFHQHLEGSHAGEVPPQALVVLLGGGEPHSVVRRLTRFVFVPEDEDNLVFNIDGEAAEHGAGPRRQRRESIEHEFVRDRLTLLDAEDSVVQRKKSRFATGRRHTGLRHRSGESRSLYLCFRQTLTVYH